jgi:hypothetical protein
MILLTELWHSRLVEVIAGGLIAMAVAVGIELLRKPRLRFSIEKAEDHTYPHRTTARFQRVLVSAIIPAKSLRWIVRAPASECKAANFLSSSRWPQRFWS